MNQDLEYRLTDSYDYAFTNGRKTILIGFDTREEMIDAQAKMYDMCIDTATYPDPDISTYTIHILLYT